MTLFRNAVFLLSLSLFSANAWSQEGEPVGVEEGDPPQGQELKMPDERIQYLVSPYFAELPPSLIYQYCAQVAKSLIDICTTGYKGKSTIEVRYSSITGWTIKGGCEGLSEDDLVGFMADARYVTRKVAARLSGR